MSIWTVLWLALLVALGLVELAAILNKAPGDTLSEHVWKWFSAKDPKRAGWRGFRRAVLLLAMVWLTVHFTTGGRV